MLLVHHLVYPVLIACVLAFVYKILPSVVKGKLCPVVFCAIPIVQCVREPECRVVLDCMAECDNADSKHRRDAMAKYKHLQFPQDRALCDYECLGLISTGTTENLVECIATRGCLQPAKYSDECAPIRQDQVLPLSAIPDDVFEGRWRKIFTNSWDTWRYQVTNFSRPGATSPEPRNWMTAWPNATNVWRMDLTWSVQPNSTWRFTMSSELYPGQRWNYPGSAKADPTLKTIARMWGTTAHENWYLLYFDQEVMLWHVCAYTVEVQSFDALTIAFIKDGQTLSKEREKTVEDKARAILGDKFGRLQRVMVSNE